MPGVVVSAVRIEPSLLSHRVILVLSARLVAKSVGV